MPTEPSKPAQRMNVKVCATCGKPIPQSGGHIHEGFAPAYQVEVMPVAELEFERQRWEQEVRERLDKIGEELCYCPTGTDDKELCNSCETIGYARANIFGEAEPVEGCPHGSTDPKAGHCGVPSCPYHGKTK